MRRQANGARPASTSERTRAMPGRRGNPEMRKVSSSNPASGTSLASTRSGDPANVTVTPRPRSASATASDGSTWPAVPPAAIRHASLLGDDPVIHRDVKEDPDRAEEAGEARASVGDERQRDAGQRREPENGREVDRGLAADEGGDACCKSLAKRVAAVQRDAKARVGEERERADHRRRADETELLADDGEDHVGVRFGQVEDLLHAVPEALARPAARADADDRLDGLKA